MSSRRPQDPRTKRVPDDEQRAIETMAPDLEDLEEGGSPTARPPDKPFDPQRAISTAMPGGTLSAGIEPPRPKAQRGGSAATLGPSHDRTMTAERMEAVRAQVRARAAAESQSAASPAKKRGSWIVWVFAFLALGGIGFGVAWFVMNPPGGGESESESVASGEGEGDESGQGGAGDEAAADASESASADAAPAADGGGAQAAAADGGADGGAAAAEEVAVAAAVADAAAEAAGDDGADAGAVAAADAGTPESPDAAVAAAADAAVAAAADAGADGATGDAASAVVAGDAGAAEDARAVAAADAAAVAVADAKATIKPPVRDPIEATRLNEDGLAARKTGDHQAAMSFYQKALAADPEHVWARYNYACELALAKRTKEALAELTTLYKLGTSDAKKALSAARRDSDFASIKDTGQFFRLTNF